MKKSWLFGVAVLAACGGSGGSAPIDGLYQVTETVTASSCPTVAVGTTSGDTITVTTSGTTATAMIASFGGSCPGQIDGEHVTWSCKASTLRPASVRTWRNHLPMLVFGSFERRPIRRMYASAIIKKTVLSLRRLLR